MVVSRLEIWEIQSPVVQLLQLFVCQILTHDEVSLPQSLQIVLSKFHHLTESHWFQFFLKKGDPRFEHGLYYNGTADD